MAFAAFGITCSLALLVGTVDSTVRLLIAGAVVGAGIIAVAMLVRCRPSGLAVLVIAGTLLLDFAPLRIYRYFLWSDFLLLAAFVAVLWRRRTIAVVIPAAVTPVFAVFLLGHLLAFARASSAAEGLFTWLHMAFLMVLFVPAVATLLADRHELRAVVFGAILTAAVVQAAIIDVAVLSGQQWESGSRIAGALGNVAVWLFACGYVGLVSVMMAGRWPARLLAAGSLLLLTPAVMFLRARMLWVAIVTGCVLLFIMQAKTWGRALAMVAISTGLLVSMYSAGLLPGAIQSRIEATLHPSRSVDLVYRLEVVRRLAPPFAASPLVGIGLGQSGSYLPPDFVAGRVGAIHNVVLHAGVEGGLPAAFAMLLLPVAFIVMWIRAKQSTAPAGPDRLLAHWLLASLLGIYVGAQFTPALYEHVVYFLIGFLASLAGGRPVSSMRHP
jgi:O-antigen ligase